MKKVYIELTNRCNLNCEMCYRHSWENTLGDMSKEIIDKISAHLNGTKGIVFGGIGEPTIAKEFEYAVEKFKQYDLEITTNGIVRKSIIEILCKNFKKIIISVDGTEDDYFSVRKTEFSHIRDTIKYINVCKNKNDSRFPSIEFAFVLTKSNKDTIYKVIDFANKYSVDKLLVSHLLPQNEEQTKDIFYTKDYNYEGHEYMKLVSKYAIYGNRVNLAFPYMEIKTERYCQFIENDYTYVDYLGDVVPCYRFANTYTEWVFNREKTVLKHSFGNILENNINEIYYNKEYTDFRQSVLNTKHPSCVDCEYEDSCSFIETTEFDCLSYSPSCADCLWNRNIIKCT